MDDVKPLIRTIKSIKTDGKWIEVWFDEKLPNDKSLGFHYSEKTYMFWSRVDKFGLSEHVVNIGVNGLKVCLFYNSPNWEMFCFVREGSNDQ